MNSILFVVKSENIFQRFTTELHSLEHRFDVTLVRSHEEAVGVVKSAQVDIIITEFTAGGADDRSFLEFVFNEFPQIIRIVLSDAMANESNQFEVSRLIQSVVPLSGSTTDLIKTVNRITNLKRFMDNPYIMKIIGSINDLPTLPKVYRELDDELNSEVVSIRRIEKIIESDPALTAKILQLSNSAFFSTTVRTTDILSALSLIGFGMLRSMVLLANVVDTDKFTGKKRLFLDKAWSDALKVSKICEYFAGKYGLSEYMTNQLRIAAILHPIGKILMLSVPGYLEEITQLTDEKNISWEEAEREKYRTSNFEVGAYLLGVWNLPEPIIEAISNIEITHTNDFSSLSGLLKMAYLEAHPPKTNENE